LVLGEPSPFSAQNSRSNSCLGPSSHTTVSLRFNGFFTKTQTTQARQSNFFTQIPQIVDKFLIA